MLSFVQLLLLVLRASCCSDTETLIFALLDTSFKQENMLEQRNQLKCLEFARVFDELLKVPSLTLIVVNLAAISPPPPRRDQTAAPLPAGCG